MGKVFLVGAGPGDPELITVKGCSILCQADIVFFDALIDEKLLEFCPPNCKKVFVGKQANRHSISQKNLNEKILVAVKKNKIIVRLKGGDPFLFGRGGEEVLFLRTHGVPVSVIPGVSSALAAPAAAGIPLTHRAIGSSVAIVAGHLAKHADFEKLPWQAYAALDTIVFLMGVGNLARIVKHLRAAGRSAETPTAVIANGTLPNQKTIVGTLKTIVGKVARAKIQPPAVIVVGDVAKLNLN